MTFDPAKDAENVRKHGISLARAEDFDEDTALYDLDDSQDYGEERWNLVGWLDARLHTLTVTYLPDNRIRDHTGGKRVPTNTETEPAYGVPDADNPEWTREKFARSKRFHELPAGLQEALKRGKRGPQKSPTKELISVRLSPDVLSALRAKGDGWQTLIDETLRREFVRPQTDGGVVG